MDVFTQSYHWTAPPNSLGAAPPMPRLEPSRSPRRGRPSLLPWPHQLAVGIKGGAEAIIHAAPAYETPRLKWLTTF